MEDHNEFLQDDSNVRDKSIASGEKTAQNENLTALNEVKKECERWKKIAEKNALEAQAEREKRRRVAINMQKAHDYDDVAKRLEVATQAWKAEMEGRTEAEVQLHRANAEIAGWIALNRRLSNVIDSLKVTYGADRGFRCVNMWHVKKIQLRTGATVMVLEREDGRRYQDKKDGLPMQFTSDREVGMLLKALNVLALNGIDAQSVDLGFESLED